MTSPRGGTVQVYDVDAARYDRSIAEPDACGVATSQGNLLVTSGTGALQQFPDGQRRSGSDLRWDNHLVAI